MEVECVRVDAGDPVGLRRSVPDRGDDPLRREVEYARFEAGDQVGLRGSVPGRGVRLAIVSADFASRAFEDRRRRPRLIPNRGFGSQLQLIGRQIIHRSMI